MSKATRSLYIKSTAFAGGSKITLALAGVISIWQLNILLGKDLFGAFMIVFALCQIISAALCTFSRSIILYYEADQKSAVHEKSKLALGAITLASLTIFIAISLTAQSLAALFNKPELATIFTALSGYIPACSMNMSLASWHRAQQDIKTLTLYNEITPALLRIIGLAAFALSPTISSLTPELKISAISALFIASFALPCIALYCKKPIAPHFNLNALTLWDLRYGVQATLGNLISKSSRNVVIVLSGALASTAVTADFAIASRFGQLLLIPKNAILQLLTPRLRAHLKSGKKDALQREFIATQTIMSLATLIVIIAYLLCAPYILKAFGDYGQSAYHILLILSIASLARASFGDTGGLMTMAGRSGITLIAHMIGFISLFAGFFMLVPHFGGIGAAYATCASAIIPLSYMAFTAHQKESIQTIGWPEILTLTLSSTLIIAVSTHNLSTIIASFALTILCALYGMLRKNDLSALLTKD